MTTDLAHVLAGALGADRLRPAEAPDDLVDGVTPGVVILPQTAEEMAAALAWATRERMSVVIRGAGSKDTWGRPASRVHVLVRMDRLHRVIDHAAGDLTVTVEAGARLADVNARLGAHRQFLPLDPPHAPWATIGGLLGANDAGPLRHRFGTPSDLVLGVTLATADGVVATSGGRVVKNVAGYDLSRLLAGSHGTLAAVVNATFKLVPEPDATGTAVIEGDVVSLQNVITAIFATQLDPMAVEVTATGGHGRATLYVLFGSDAATVSRSIAQLSTVATGLGARASALAVAEEPAFWQRRGPDLVSFPTVLRLSWLPAALDRALAAVGAGLGTTPWTLRGRAAVGAGHLGIDADGDVAREAIRALRASPAVGSVVIAAGSRALREAVDVWPPSANEAVLTRLKQAWDAAGVLGAGRGPL